MVADNLCMGCMRDIGSEKQCPYCGFHADTPQITPYLPLRTVIADRYVIGKMQSAGGDGVTYMGWDLRGNIPVSIREFLPERYCTREYEAVEVAVNSSDAELYNTLLQEFLELWRTLARGRELQGLIPVIDIIEENNTAYAVSEYIETITLRDFLLKSKTGTVSWDRLKSILMPLFTTVSTLHSAGVYHLGISPNTLVLGRDGKLRLTGFMINEARCQNTDLDAVLTGGYAAIEQYAYIEDTGSWSDVYALAGVIYRALIGSTPVEATERITNDKLMIPPKIAETLPAYLISALDHAIMVEPAERTGDIDTFREELSGSPSAMAYTRSAVEAASTSQEELNERKRLEKIAIQEQNKQRQIKITVISFLVVLCLGLLSVGAYFLFFNKNAEEGETTTAAAASEMIEVIDFVSSNSVYSRVANDEVLKERYTFIVEYEYSDEFEQGYIMSQSIEPGTMVEKGAEIVLKVSKGKEQIVLTDVTGKLYEEAEAILSEAGFVCKKVEKNNDGTHTYGEVVSVTPEPGETYEKGREVFLTVWGPVPETTVPAEPETVTSASLGENILDALGSLGQELGILG